METKITTVAAQGQAEAPFTLAQFHLQLSAFATTVPVAKTRLGLAVAEVNAALDALKAKLGLEFVKNSLRTSSNVQEHYDYNRTTGEQVHKGYNISYSMSFKVDLLDKVSEIYDALTSLNTTDSANVKLSVSAPMFDLKSRDRINKRALKNAFQKVQDRFQTECEVLGLDSTGFEITTWETTYSDGTRSDRLSRNVRAQGAAHPAPGAMVGGVYSPSIESASLSLPVIDFNVGLASVSVNLEVGYVRRAPLPVKATVIKNTDNVDRFVTDNTVSS